jgi:hypothetical protein
MSRLLISVEFVGAGSVTNLLDCCWWGTSQRVARHALSSYRFFGVSPLGTDVDGGIIDRPDLVNALFHEIYCWAGLTPPN